MNKHRRCFTFNCDGVPTGNHWECDRCRARIHAASEAATRQAKQTPHAGGSFQRAYRDVSHPQVALGPEGDSVTL